MKLFTYSFALLTLAACGDPWTPAAGPSASDEGPDDADRVQSVAWLVAAEGGVVEAPDGRARLVVPPGALEQDGEVAIGVERAGPDTMSPAYVVAPEGLRLKAAVFIEIDLVDEVRWGSRVSAAMYLDHRWEELPESIGVVIDHTTHAGDARGSVDARPVGGIDAPQQGRHTVVGALLHSGMIAVVRWEDVALARSFCEAAELSDCAGSPLGVWRMDGACAPGLAELNDPFEGRCPELQASVELRWQGTFEIGELAVSAAIDASDTIISVAAPLSCEAASADSCAALSHESRACVASGGACRCVERHRDPASDSALPISIEGDELVVSDGFGHERSRIRYCVQGERLLLEARATGSGLEALPTFRYVLHR